MPSVCKKCRGKDNYNFVLNIGLCDPCIGTELERLQKIVNSFRVQCTAAMKATSLGLCKRVIKHALDDDYYPLIKE